ncbi:MAG: hypothetical protein ACE5KV_09475 [Thermoplasmata archaeon]
MEANDCEELREKEDTNPHSSDLIDSTLDYNQSDPFVVAPIIPGRILLPGKVGKFSRSRISGRLG